MKSENVNLEDELASYTRRRDHLLAVNARLAIPLIPQSNLYKPISLLLFLGYIIISVCMIYMYILHLR